MDLRARTIQEPKELGEVMDVLEKATVIMTGSASDKLAQLTGLLPDIVKAADGFNAISEELKDSHVYEAAGAFAGRIAQTLIVKKV